MKKVLTIMIIGLMIGFSVPSYAQLTEPGDPGDGSGGTGGHSSIPGGGAPIGSSLALVLGLGLAYGAKKTYDLKTEE